MNPKRILCVLLTAVMLLGLCPVYACAADTAAHTETEANNNVSTANNITLGEEWTGSLSTKEDKDYYCVTIPKDGYITRSFRHEVCDISASTWKLSFYDTQNIVSEEPHFSTYFNGDNAYTLTSNKIGIAAGTYYVVVEMGSFYSEVPYTFQIDFTEADHYEHLNNNTSSTAQKVSLSTTYTGSLVTETDEDWYVFTVATKGSLSVSFNHVNISTEGPNAPGYYSYWTITLYDSNMKLLAGDSSRALDPAGIDPTGVTAGTYYLQVKKSAHHNSNWYNFSISFEETEFNETEPNNTFEKANTLLLNRYMYGFANLTGDYFVYTAASDGTVDIQLTGDCLEAFLYNGDQKTRQTLNFDRNKGINSTEVQLTKGIYYIHLVCDQRYSTYGSNYTLFVTDHTHSHDYKVKSSTAVTCTSSGYEKYQCQSCGHKYTKYYNTPLGHDWGEWQSNGSEIGSEIRSCTRCDATETHALKSYSSQVIAPTCTKEGYTVYICSCCQKEYRDNFTPILDHTWDSGKVTKVPTIDAVGEKTFTCTVCKETKTEDIPKLTHNPFTDISESAWYFAPVMWAVENKVTGGISATEFGPNNGCTRAQVVTFLWAANGKPEPKSMDNPFEDVANDAWYVKPVLWAVEQGITGGVAEGQFGPDQTCTRAQIATFLYAAKGKPQISGSSPFDDVADTDWYAKSVIWAKENEVTGGISETEFGPNQVCTRAQVVTFLYKVYGSK